MSWQLRLFKFFGGFGGIISIGSIGYGSYAESTRAERARRFKLIEDKFRGQSDDSEDETALVSRTFGAIDNDQGITYANKLHRDNKVSSHQYPNQEVVLKTGILAQCICFLWSKTNAMPFSGAGDLYLIRPKAIVKDLHGEPAIYSRDAATQLRISRSPDLSDPKTMDVAYVRREHHPPPGSSGERFVDKNSAQQFKTLTALAEYQQDYEYNEVVANLKGSDLCASFLYLKDEAAEKTRPMKELAIQRLRLFHKRYLGNAAVDKMPIIEFQKDPSGGIKLINREDLASRWLVLELREVLGKLGQAAREELATHVYKSFFFAKTKSADKPFVKPDVTTNLYANFVLFSCAGTLPLAKLTEIQYVVRDFVKEAEQARERRKEQFSLHQHLLSKADPDARARLEEALAEHRFEKVLEFNHDVDHTPFYVLDYLASRKVVHYTIESEGQVHHLVVSPVGFNQNWRFKDLDKDAGRPTHTKPKVVSSKDIV